MSNLLAFHMTHLSKQAFPAQVYHLMIVSSDLPSTFHLSSQSMLSLL